MTSAARRYGINWDGDITTLNPARIAALPATATSIIGRDLATHHITAQRIARLRVDDTLHLEVYHVDPPPRRREPGRDHGPNPRTNQLPDPEWCQTGDPRRDPIPP